METELIHRLLSINIDNLYKWVFPPPSLYYKQYISLLNLDKRISKNSDIHREITILSSVQLYYYYLNYQLVDHTMDCLISCLLIIRTIYSEKNYLSNDFLYYVSCIYPISMYNMSFYQKDILKTFNYSFHTIPMTINYCLFIDMTVDIYMHKYIFTLSPFISSIYCIKHWILLNKQNDIINPIINPKTK